MNTKILRGILVSLLQCDGVAMPENALIGAAQIMCRPHEPTDADITDRMKNLQAHGLILGVTDDLTKERSWTLTTTGVHKARQLR